jgi:predicted phosphodiesterase
MLHNLNTLHLDPTAGKFVTVFYGHTHVPRLHFEKEVLYFNPGSCGPRRFQLPVTVGLLTISDEGEFDAELIAVDCV